jgi:hypothetical protein
MRSLRLSGRKVHGRGVADGFRFGEDADAAAGWVRGARQRQTPVQAEQTQQGQRHCCQQHYYQAFSRCSLSS